MMSSDIKNLKLTPIIHPSIKRFLEEKELVFDLVNAFGSPLNILFPENIKKNIQKFNEVFKEFNINGKIFFAHKPNKSNALVKQASIENVNIDVASFNELKSALNNGFAPKRIEATGPKNFDFLSLCIQQNILISVDNLSEIKQVIEINKALGSKSSILIRLNEFKSNSTSILKKDTKFGISTKYLNKIKEILKNTQYVELKGFTFHLTTSSEIERSIALESLILTTLDFIKEGFNPNILNIGGGFSTNFLENENEWTQYISELKKSLIDQQTQLSWDSNGLGFWVEDGKIRGSPVFSEYFRKINQFKELKSVLSYNSTILGTTLGQFISENMFELYIEPGRSMLDQVGITIARINFIKKSLKGETIIGLDMNRSNLNSGDLEMMVDPVILSKSLMEGEKVGVYFVGNLCLPHDFIYKHKTFLNEPSENDLVIFTNTAGYYMDFAESNTLQQKVAEKIAIKEINGQFKWFKDSEFNPLKNYEI